MINAHGIVGGMHYYEVKTIGDILLVVRVPYKLILIYRFC